MSAGDGERGPTSRFPRAGWVLCPACQTENRAGSRFCERCGTKLPRPGETTRREEPAAPPTDLTAAPAAPPEQPLNVAAPGTALLFRPEEDAPPATPTTPLPPPRDTVAVPVERPPLAATPAGPVRDSVHATVANAPALTTPAVATNRAVRIVAVIALGLLLVCSLLGVLLVFLGAIDLPPYAPPLATIAATPRR